MDALDPIDPVSAEWLSRVFGDGGLVPRREVIAACRELMDDRRLLRLVRQLSMEGALTRYVKGDAFLDLVRSRVNDPRRRVSGQ